VDKTCEECLNPFEAKRATARFCSTTCRVRHHRKQGPRLPADVKRAAAAATIRAAKAEAGQAVDTEETHETSPAEEASAPADSPEGPRARRVTVESTVLAELERADKVATVLGQAALVLARRLDLPSMDTGSAIAALVKQLETTLAAALADAKEDNDELEELRRRREARMAAGQ